MSVYKAKNEIPTIDCNLVTVSYNDGDETREIGFDTANKIEVEVQTEDEDAIKLVVKGKLRAQKPEVSTVTGNRLTLTDNVFNPELVLLMQGGVIQYAVDNPNKIESYSPPVAGSDDKGETFTLNVYSAQYDASGLIRNYEKISYPNCKGVPVAFSSEDGAFRAPEYVINSAPSTGEAPYTISYIEDLPTLEDQTV